MSSKMFAIVCYCSSNALFFETTDHEKVSDLPRFFRIINELHLRGSRMRKGYAKSEKRNMRTEVKQEVEKRETIDPV